MSQDELPLKLEDLTGESYENYIRENDKKSLLLRQSISQRPRLDRKFQELPELEYSLITVKLPVLYDRWAGSDPGRVPLYPEETGIYQEEDAGALRSHQKHTVSMFQIWFPKSVSDMLGKCSCGNPFFPWEPDEGRRIVGKKFK